MSELATTGESDDVTVETDSNHESQGPTNEQVLDSVERNNEALRLWTSNQSEFLQRQKGVEELLGKFLERQQSVEHLLSQVLQQQNQTIDNELNIAGTAGQTSKNQTVGGDENPASEITTASDRGARDIFAAHSLLSLRDPGELTIDKSAVDLNPRLYYQTLPDESSRQCVQSLEGATHASIQSLELELSQTSGNDSLIQCFPT